MEILCPEALYAWPLPYFAGFINEWKSVQGSMFIVYYYLGIKRVKIGFSTKNILENKQSALPACVNAQGVWIGVQGRMRQPLLHECCSLDGYLNFLCHVFRSYFPPRQLCLDHIPLQL